MPDDISAGQRLVSDLSREGDPCALTVMIVEVGRIADRLMHCCPDSKRGGPAAN
jgi:hypothetical protein